MSQDNPKIVYGTVDLLPEKIDPKDVTCYVRIAIRGDLLDAIKARADEEEIHYTKVIDHILKGYFKL